MLCKLAFRNVRRQFSSYAIYFITVMLTITMIFAVNNIIQSDIMSSLLINYFRGTKAILTAITGILALIMAFVLGYATNFLLKKRKKEFALYLIMGMNRKNIIAIFMLETAFTFVFALGAGILLGLLFYQVLMGIFISYIQLEYTVTGYSPVAFVYTIGIVCAVFLLSSVASAGYLKFAKIARLLNGEKIAEKTVKHPVLWIVFAAAGLVGTVVFANLFVDWLGTPDFFRTLYYAAVIIVFIVAFVILGSMGLCKGITWLIVKVRSGRAKSCGMFTARQLSGSASANSVMMGLLAVLMSLAIVGPNIFFSMSDIYTASVDETYLYDISGSFSTYEHDEGEIEDMRDTFTEQYTDIISEYVGIENYASFYIYKIYFEEQYVVSYYTQVKYSDFKNICKVLGYDLPADIGERFACRVSDSTAEPFEWNGDELLCPYNILLGYAADFIVVPDDEIQGTPAYGVLCVDVQDVKYDARALDAKVNWIDERHNKHRVLTIKEYERLDELGQGGLFLLGDLYASVVFLLLTLAILSLKMLTMVSEDKPKYAIMWKMGATKSQLFRSMLAQLLFFCCLPFVIPVYINVPLASAISLMYESSGYAMPLGKVIAQLSGFTLAALGVCVLYLIAVSIVAWYDIRRAFCESQ